MSICMWCDTHEGPYPASDADAQTMTMEVPEIKDGVKVGVAYVVERHRCGECAREERRSMDRRRAISAGVRDAEEHLNGAEREHRDRRYGP